MNRKIKKVTFNIIIVAALLCGFAWVVSRFVHLGRVEYTDNAQVRQHIVPVNSRVQGFIKEIRFEEYRHVRKGDTLAIIEDAEYRLRVAQAEADLQNARVGKTAMNTSISTISNNLEVSDAGIAEVEVLMRNAGKDYERYQKLVEQKAVTRREYDQVKANYESLKAKYDMLTRQKRSTALTRDEQSQRLAQTEAGIRLAEAALELARLNLSYTVVVAPCNGVTSRKAVQEGQLVQPGQTLLMAWGVLRGHRPELPQFHRVHCGCGGLHTDSGDGGGEIRPGPVFVPGNLPASDCRKLRNPRRLTVHAGERLRQCR